MADLELKKPASGQITNFTPTPEDRIVFDFDTGDATLGRVEDSLELSFEDGSKIVLTDFYEAYGQDNMPTFLIHGEEVPGEAFFAANEDLMPAAGDGGAGVSSGGTIISFLDGTLLTGIDRLGRLDQERIGSNDDDFATRGIGNTDDGSDSADSADGDVGDTGNINTSPVIQFSLSDLDLNVVESGVQQDNDNPNASFAGTAHDVGNISATDADSDTLHYSIGNDGIGGLGTLSVDSNGNLTYTLNNDDNDTQGLAAGAIGYEQFTVTVSDGVNPPVSTTVTVQIVGTNDRPTITGIEDANGNPIDFTFSVTELAGTDDAVFSGTITGDDVDSDDDAASVDFFVTTTADAKNYGADTLDAMDDKSIDALGKNVDGTYGSLTIDEDGNFEYIMTSDALGKGEEATESFTVFVKDQHGAWQAQEIVVNLTGTNDGPTDLEFSIDGGSALVMESGVGRDSDGDIIDSANPGNENASFGGALTVTGTLSAKDADINDDLTFSATESVVRDAQGIIIDGVSGDDFGSFDITNSSDPSDKNSGDFAFTLNEGTANTPNSFVDSLNEGEKVDITYTVEASDGKGGITTNTVTITVEGTNDRPVMTSAVAAGEGDIKSVIESTGSSDTYLISHNAVTEDAADTTIEGRLSITDADDDGKLSTDQTLSVVRVDNGGNAMGAEVSETAGTDSSLVIHGEYGTLTVNPDGSYSYTLQGEPNLSDYGDDPNDSEYLAALERYDSVQDLTEESSAAENFVVTTTDKHGASDSVQLDFVVKGADDKPTIEFTDPTATSETVIVDEAFLENGSTEGRENDGSAAMQTGTIIFNFGTNEPADSDIFAWDLSTSALPDVYNHDGEQLSWRVNGETGDIEGYIGDDVYISVGMELGTFIDGKINGEYTVTLHKPIEHDAPDSGESHDENQDLASKGNTDNLDTPTDLNFGFTITDADGNTANGNLTVNVEDDVIDITNAEGETVHLDSPSGDVGSELDFFTDNVSAESIKNALREDADTELEVDESWNSHGYKGNFYGNDNADPSKITTVEGIVIQGVILNNKGDISSEGVNLGWREDNTDKDNDGIKDYGDGLGMTSSTGSDSHYEVGSGGSYADGDSVEALIVTLPEGNVAYGVDLSFSCLFTSKEDGGDSADKDAEYVTLEFYKDGELVYSVRELVGNMSGDNTFSTSSVSAPFDELRIIPSENGSDFTLNGIGFSDYDNDVVASGSGTIQTEGADGLDEISFESITVGGTSVDVKDGNVITLGDGTELTLVDMGNNVFVAVGEDAFGAKSDYFTLSLDAGGSWTILQHKHFGDSLEVSFKATDKDGDNASHTVTIVGDAAPEAQADSNTVTEGGEAAQGDILENDSFGADGKPEDSDVFDLSTVVKVDGVDVTWTKNTAEDGSVTLSHPDYGTLTIDKDGDYNFDYTDKSLGTGEKSEFEFGYTIKDSDGDSSSSALTITATGTNTVPELIFDTSGATSNEHVTYDDVNDSRDIDSDQDDDAQSVGGKFTVTLGEGMNVVTIVGAYGEELHIYVSEDGVIYTDENNAIMGPEDMANFTLEGEYGGLSDISYNPLTGEVTYTYTQDGNQAHGTDENPLEQGDSDILTESFQITVTDADKDSSTGSINIAVTDDGVTLSAHVDFDDVYVDPIQENVTVTVKVSGMSYEFEADAVYEAPKAAENSEDNTFSSVMSGKIAVEGADTDISLELVKPSEYSGTVKYTVEVEINGQSKFLALEIEGNTVYGVEGEYTDGSLDLSDPYFTFTLNADGTWDYEQLKPFEGDIPLSVQGTDADGDTDIHNIIIESTQGGFPIGFTVTDALETDEGAMASGTHIDKDADNDGFVDNMDKGSMTITTGESPEDITITIEGQVLKFDKDGDLISVDGNTSLNTVKTDKGSLSNITLKGDGSGDGVHLDYTYTQTESAEHDETVGEGEVASKGDTIDITVSTASGDSASTSVHVGVTDDVPTEHRDVSTSTTTDTASTIVNIDFGADDGDGKSLEFGGSTFTYGVDAEGKGSWSSEDGSVNLDGDKFTLTAADGTSLSNSNDNSLWTATVNGVTEGGKDVTVTVTDADGDSDSFDIIATKDSDTSDDVLVGLGGAATHIEPGANYNISIVLDTSGSMYHDTHGDIKGDDTRLDAACDALVKFVGELYEHATSDIGGEVNLQVVTFWGSLDVIVDGSKPLEDVYNDVIAEINALRELTKNDADPDFHWQTDYEQAFEASAGWFSSEDIKSNGYENEVFFISDGDPTKGSADVGFSKLEQALEDAGGGKIHAIGMGAGADKTELDKYDTGTGDEAGATIVTDSDISDIFTPNTGEVSLEENKANIAETGQGDDILMGGVDIGQLRENIAAALELPLEQVTDAMLIEFMQNYPEWVMENTSSAAADPDILLAGSENDLLYGQSGDDLLIGDGDMADVTALAGAVGDAEGSIGETGYTTADYEEDALKEDMTAEQSADLIQNLMDDVRDTLTSGTAEEKATVEEAILQMEESNDGDDTLYGGTGDDLMLGLGGNDMLFGGEGDDVVLGGSGNDYLDGGQGADTIMGGSGDDLIKLDMHDVFVDGGKDIDGTDLDVVLGSLSDIDTDATRDKVLDMMASGDIEMGVFGDNISGKSVDDVLSELGLSKNDKGEVSFDKGTWTVEDVNSDYAQYTTMSAGGDEMTILIAKTSIENTTF